MSPLRPHSKDTAKRLDQRSNPSAASPPRLTIFKHVLYVPEQRDNVKCFCLYGYISVSPSHRQTPVSQLGQFARFSPENYCDAAKFRAKTPTRSPTFGHWLELMPAKRKNT